MKRNKQHLLCEAPKRVSVTKRRSMRMRWWTRLKTAYSCLNPSVSTTTIHNKSVDIHNHGLFALKILVTYSLTDFLCAFVRLVLALFLAAAFLQNFRCQFLALRLDIGALVAIWSVFDFGSPSKRFVRTNPTNENNYGEKTGSVHI